MHQIKKFALIKRNNYQNEESVYPMGQIFSSSSLDKGLILRIYKALQISNTEKTKIQLTNGQMNR
jgi:hypothetical protein